MKKIIIVSVLLVVLLVVSMVDVFSLVPVNLSSGEVLICETNSSGQEVCKVLDPCDFCGSVDTCNHDYLILFILPFLFSAVVGLAYR